MKEKEIRIAYVAGDERLQLTINRRSPTDALRCPGWSVWNGERWWCFLVKENGRYRAASMTGFTQFDIDIIGDVIDAHEFKG